MQATPDELDELSNKLNRETGKIPWSELQRFFARGQAIWVDNHLDLIKVTAWVAQDAHEKIESLMQNGHLAPVTDAKAIRWNEENATLWAVVAAPWVLVQEID